MILNRLFRRQHEHTRKPEIPESRLRLECLEGSTEVDIELRWENPPTTVYVECKYGSALSTRTNQNDGSKGFPGDQLVRNIRVGLYESGYYRSNALFESTPRDFRRHRAGPRIRTIPRQEIPRSREIDVRHSTQRPDRDLAGGTVRRGDRLRGHPESTPGSKAILHTGRATRHRRPDRVSRIQEPDQTEPVRAPDRLAPGRKRVTASAVGLSRSWQADVFLLDLSRLFGHCGESAGRTRIGDA